MTNGKRKKEVRTWIAGTVFSIIFFWIPSEINLRITILNSIWSLWDSSMPNYLLWKFIIKSINFIMVMSPFFGFFKILKTMDKYNIKPKNIFK